jgi:ATP-dependent DNA helicase DinG
MPDPRSEDTFERSREVIEQILRVSKGRAFCLFTSYKAMIRMHTALEGRIPFPLFLHGSMSRKELLSRFRSTPNAVLFGTSSFWQGVDVQGDQLSCVIIDRLPFAVPSDPIVVARMNAIEKAGGNSFFDYQIPHAVIALKQGFGRLVRSTQDYGILAILDPRIRHPRYGRVFLDSLPDYTVTSDLKVAAEFLRPPSLKKK